MDGPFVLYGNVPVSNQQGPGGQQGRARSLRLVSKGERGAAEFAGEHLLSARNEGRRRLHRRPRGQVSKFPTGAAEERQENPWSRGHPPEAKSSHCGRT